MTPSTPNGPRILIVAGEASGDAHGARLVDALRRRRADLRFFGVGGARMHSAGVEMLANIDKMAAMGLTEVFARLPYLLGLARRLRRILRDAPPALLILIDYPGFNLRLAKAAHRLGVPVLYYIGPKIWASRPGRLRALARWVDHTALIFPFEPPLYAQAGAAATFVGHPLVGEVHCTLSREAARARLGLDGARGEGRHGEAQGAHADAPLIGLFPGSREGELRRILPELLRAARRLRELRPGARFALPRAATLSADLLASLLEPARLPVAVVEEADLYPLIRACDAIVCASGTVVLEIALLERPMVVVYRAAALSYALLSRMVRIPHVSLANIVAQREIVPELLQSACTAHNIVNALLPLLPDRGGAPSLRAVQMCADLAAVRRLLGEGGAAENAARIALELLERRAR